MTEQTQRIFLFTDSILSSIPRQKWGTIDFDFFTSLFQEIVRPGIVVEVVDPIKCLESLLTQIGLDNFTSIIDLTGFWGNFLKENLSNILPIVDSFHLSRLRRIDSPKLDGVGYAMSLTSDEIKEIKTESDLSRPLVLDDVGWSGRTVIKAAEIFALPAENTNVAFLCGNNGNFGERPAAIELLRGLGFQVFTGKEVSSPFDDGFHLADFVHPRLEEVFPLILQLQQLRERGDEEGVGRILKEKIEFLFPQYFLREQLEDVRREGRLIIPGGLPKEGVFSTNPLAFLYPSFSRRISSDNLFLYQQELIEGLKQLRILIEEGKEEIIREERVRSGGRLEML
jgi:hypothetical protein